MTRSTENPWLHRYALLTALATLILIAAGGLVTSHGAGMAVPDWPNTFGYNMFFFPISKWVGNVFYEHSHRLIASAVGLMTVILAVWIWLKDSRAWMRWLGLAAVVAVVVQGILGGLRVVWLKDELGIFHATLAQLFFTAICCMALFTSRRWNQFQAGMACMLDKETSQSSDANRSPEPKRLNPQGQSQIANLKSQIPGFMENRSVRRMFLVITILVLFQLMLGATMRHQHAGLAIPDFPTAHGSWWPDTSAESIARYNRERPETKPLNPITPFQIVLQMIHRLMALAILIGATACAWFAHRRLGPGHDLTRLAWLWLGLILIQAGLGAATIWTGKSADVATAHVVVGALCLMTGVFGIVAALRARREDLLENAPARFSREPLATPGPARVMPAGAR